MPLSEPHQKSIEAPDSLSGSISPERPITRIAPSPTGALHLGNARTFLINWALAKQNNWSIVLRIEDLDTPRVKPGVIDQTIETLQWLGLDWDTGPIIQSDDLDTHRQSMEDLTARCLAYPCKLTRTEIQAAASAPNEGEHEQRYDPSLRPTEIPSEFHDDGINWRFLLPDEPVKFDDAFMGTQSINPSQSIGDFVIWTKRQSPSYQLAVVVDDHHQAITQIVRGDDLLDSAARQIQLRNALSYNTPITYTHLPLIRGQDGRRLAKRHGDTRIDHYRSLGTSQHRMLGLLAYWCGITASRTEISLNDFLEGFKLDTLPAHDCVFTHEDDQWLTS